MDVLDLDGSSLHQETITLLNIKTEVKSILLLIRNKLLRLTMATICRDYKLLFIMVPGTGCSSVGQVLIEKFGGEFIPKEHLYKNNKKILGRKHNKLRDLVQFNLISRFEIAIYLKFGTVRNPFDSFATQYARNISDKWIEKEMSWKSEDILFNSKEQKQLFVEKLRAKLQERKEKLLNIGFETWLEQRIYAYLKKDTLSSPLLKPLKSFIYSENYVPSIYSPLLRGVDKVMRFEHLEEDFNKILKEGGIIQHNEWVIIPHTNPTKDKKPYQEYYTKKARKLVEKNFARELAVFDYKF
ncbi:unknown [Crocosphaera subtropica ATCC 51142]|uniref:Uncharacterized protein n=2 Tax=Crocosphaera TaxID=263510 RepID=B1WVA8_CROS5|nr:unknown [Crocosphaera subtropica ATCC 51142]